MNKRGMNEVITFEFLEEIWSFTGCLWGTKAEAGFLGRSSLVDGREFS